MLTSFQTKHMKQNKHILGFSGSGGYKILKLEMWANAQRDGRPVYYRWRPLFNAAKFG